MKILVEIHHGLGDVVQMIPLFQRLRETYIDAEIAAIVASEEHAQILRLTNYVDKYYFLKLKDMNLYQQLKFIINIRKEQYDIGIIVPMTTAKLGRLLMRSVGCKKIIAPIKTEVYQDSTSVMKGLSLLEQVGIKSQMMIPQIQLPSKFDNLAKSLLSGAFPKEKNKYIGICVGTGLVSRGRGIKKENINAKGINPKITIDVANRLKEEGYNIILLGGKAEKALLEKYKHDIPLGIISFAGATSILQSFALMSKCELIIGGDTGLVHIADAIGVKTLVYYAASGPLVGPFSEKTKAITANLECQYCYGTNKIFDCKDRRCLSYINADRIYINALNILNINNKGNA